MIEWVGLPYGRECFTQDWEESAPSGTGMGMYQAGLEWECLHRDRQVERMISRFREKLGLGLVGETWGWWWWETPLGLETSMPAVSW